MLQAINLTAITYVLRIGWQGIICNEKMLANKCHKRLSLYLKVAANQSDQVYNAFCDLGG